MDIEKRWKGKLFYSIFAMALFAVGLVNIDTTMSCVANAVNSIHCEGNNTFSMKPCQTLSLTGYQDIGGSYHTSIMILGSSIVFLMIAVLWL
jgi:hypothetical protein